jgi:sulfur-oxidizing protein SoxX
MQKSAFMAAAMLLAGSAMATDASLSDKGKPLAYDNSQGNCLACHMMPTRADAEAAGNSGPPLIAMRARFPNKADLRAKIWDATATRPDTLMPPFGKHKALTEAEIDAVVEFVYGL